MENILILLIIGAIVAGAVIKIVKDKKNGVRCSGCPHSKNCSAQASCSDSYE